jgi:hypothetical protein
MSETRSDYDRFVGTVFDPSDIVEFRLIKGDFVKKHWAIAGDCHPYESRFRDMNDRGWNVYAGVNPRIELNKSGDANVRLGRWIFADFDHIEPGNGCGLWEFVSDRICQAGLDAPDLVISSGNGLHCYWKLSAPLTDMDRWRKTQERLILTLDSDPVIKNLERIMRVPGFQNVKDSRNPKQCSIILGDIDND